MVESERIHFSFDINDLDFNFNCSYFERFLAFFARYQSVNGVLFFWFLHFSTCINRTVQMGDERQLERNLKVVRSTTFNQVDILSLEVRVEV